MMLAEEPLDPATYYSALTNFTLKVVPSSRYGEGHAQYTFLRGKEIAWEKQLGFTLRDVKITSDGKMAGYSYSTGFQGHGEKPGEMGLWILDATGETRFSRSVLRNMNRPLDSPEYPYCVGTILHEEYSNVIFRIYPEGDGTNREKWVVVSLETCRERGSFAPAQDIRSFGDGFREVLPVPGRPYFVVFDERQTSCYSKANQHVLLGQTAGTVFTIFDYKGNLAWREENADDLDHTVLDCKEEYVRTFLDDHPLMGVGRAPGEFWVLHLGKDEKVTHRVAEDGRVATIRREKLNWVETCRKHDTDELKKTWSYFNAPRYLRSLEVVVYPPPGSMPEQIYYFDFDRQNNMGCIAVQDRTCFFYLISETNKVLSWRQLDQRDWGRLWPSCLKSWTDGKWFLLLSRFDEDSRLLVLSSQGDVEKEVPIEFAGANRMVVDRKGNFAILGQDKIRQYSAGGKVMWTFDEYVGSSLKGPGALLSPCDIALSSYGEIVVLDRICQEVHYYSSEGKCANSIAFRKTESGELAYPSHVSVRPCGVVYVKEHGGGSVHKYSRDGKWLGAFDIRYPDGMPVGYIRDMTFDRRARLWISDGRACCLGAGGYVAGTLGTLAPQGVLRNISSIATDSQGNLYVLDRRGGVVVSLAPDGRQKTFWNLPERVASVLFRDDSRAMSVDSEDSINVWVADGECIRFNSDGKQVGRTALEGVTGGLVRRKGVEGYWGNDYESVFILDGTGKEVLRTERGSDGRWLRGIWDMYVDALGRCLCLEYGGGVHIFDASGKSVSSFMPGKGRKGFNRAALCGAYVYGTLSEMKLVRVTDLQGREVAVFPDPHKGPVTFSEPWLIHADAKSNRLYVCDRKSIHVFELLAQKTD